MTYQLDIQTEVEVPDRYDKILEKALSITLAQNKTPSAALTLLLTDDAHMQQLNQDFRGMKKPTDVLSFPAGDFLTGTRETIPYLGDIAISVPIAINQARASSHTLMAELQLLAVHGVLHLLGFDHVLPEEKAIMWFAQAEILNLLGLRDISPTEF